MAKQGMIFFEEYFDYMDDMTPEQYYQFMCLIRDLRYNSIDTDVNEVEDKVVRVAWRAVRPSVLKSMRNAKDYANRKGNNNEEPEVSTYTPTEEEMKEILTEDDNKANMGNYIGYIKEERKQFKSDELSDTAVNFINAYRDEWDRFIVMFRNAAYKRDQGRLDMAKETIVSKLEEYTSGNIDRSERLWAELWQWLIKENNRDTI